MSRPIAYNASGPLSGSIRGGTVNYTVDSGYRNYLAFAGKKWVPSADGAAPIIFVTDSYTRGYELDPNQSTPLFFACNGTGSADIIYTANRLPGSPGNYIDADVALESLVRTHGYFILESNDPFQGIDADSLVFDVDASKMSSYPQTATTWYDLSGNLYNTTLNNGPLFNPDGYFKFDGVDDNAGPSIYRLSPTDPTQPYTIVATIKRDGSSNGGIVTQYLTPGDANRFGFRERLGYLSWWKSSDRATATAPTVGRWAQIAGTRDAGGDVVVYVNGEQKGTGTYSDTFANHPLTIGAFATTTAPFSGSIADVKIYEKSLTPTEILQNYYGSPIITDGLIFAVDANNIVSYPKSGTSWYNLTGSISNGTLTNGPTFDQSNGGSIVFDGVDDYVILPSTLDSLNGTEEASLQMWIKLNSASNDVATTGLIQLSNYNNGNGNLYFYGNGYTYLDIFRTDRVSQVITNSTVDPTQWHMLTVTTTPGTNGWKVYWNDILKYQTTGQPTVSVNSTIQGGFTLGRNNNNNRKIWGNIASTRIYNRALTAAEVQQNYQAEQYRF